LWLATLEPRYIVVMKEDYIIDYYVVEKVNNDITNTTQKESNDEPSENPVEIQKDQTHSFCIIF